jgi:lipopolysaccharide transport system ATP-binding protein
MSDIVVRVENLGKKYRLSHQATRGVGKYTALRDVLAKSVTAPFRSLWRDNSQVANENDASATSEDFWALNDVSFEIKQGEVVGIIGRNGAGKSTLLKILSRITEPTTGRVEIDGRVSSLLEVGTGFHPELTGRENIYLNGAILGMTRGEIKKKFDEIVTFAEVEKFLDTPVKHFSSGMYVRLAFAVAAHLEPEILIVDEVLAVGDVEFQKKCLGKMQDVAKGGRTVLFVSHNMAAIRRLCTKGMMFAKGKISSIGDANIVVDSYLNSADDVERPKQNFIIDPDRTGPAFVSVEIRNAAGAPRSTLMAEEPFEVVLSIHNPLESKLGVVIGVEILDSEGISLFTSHSDDISKELVFLQPGNSSATCVFNLNPLMPGSYCLQLGMVDRQWGLVDFVRPELIIRVSDIPHTSGSILPPRPGRLMFKLPWKVNNL